MMANIQWSRHIVFQLKELVSVCMHALDMLTKLLNWNWLHTVLTCIRGEGNQMFRSFFLNSGHILCMHHRPVASKFKLVRPGNGRAKEVCQEVTT